MARNLRVLRAMARGLRAMARVLRAVVRGLIAMARVLRAMVLQSRLNTYILYLNYANDTIEQGPYCIN